MNTELLAKYMDAKAKLDRYKKLENELRLELISQYFPTASEGTHNVMVDNLKIKGRFGFNYNINEKAFWENTYKLTTAELEAVKLKPTLSISAYKKLEEHSNLDEILTVTPAMPSIEIINEDAI